jgi:proton-dependent oligopeptide transporter, POT family
MAVVNEVTSKPKFPAAIPYIIGNEFAERFNYYGMRAILSTFLVSTFFLKMTNGNVEQANALANEKTHFFISLNYFMPFLGGLLADWYWGKYKTILWLSLVYSIGSVILAYGAGVPELSIVSIGLWVIAIGSGGIKPCVSANVGDQFDTSNQSLIPKAFDMFYFSINAGSMLSMLLTPWLFKNYGAVVAFAVPGVVMLMATIVFWLGRDKYKRVPPSGPKRENFLSINIDAAKNGFSFEKIAKNWSAEALDGVKAVWRVMAVFAFVPVFWALYDQSSSEWVLQASQLDLNFLGMTLIPSQVQTANAVLVLLFIPLFSMGIYPAIERMGVAVTPLRKIGVGFFMTALSFVVIASVQTKIDAGQHPTVWWQILAYAIVTAGEILISITCLEYAYTRAPKTMKSTIMAFYLLTVSIGNIVVSAINGNKAAGGFFAKYEGASWYWLFCGICAATGVLFMLISPRLKEKIYLND